MYTLVSASLHKRARKDKRQVFLLGLSFIIEMIDKNNREPINLY